MPSDEVVEAMWRLFVHRSDVYAVQQPDGYLKVDAPLTKEVLIEHLEGKTSVGVYQIDPRDNTVKWICFDFDFKEADIEETEEKVKKVIEASLKLFPDPRSHLLEASGSPKSFHLWTFFDQPTPADVAKALGERILEKSGVQGVELFPKQTTVGEDGFGNLVKLPLGYHRRARQWSTFLDPDGKPFKPTPKESLLEVQGVILTEKDFEGVRRRIPKRRSPPETAPHAKDFDVQEYFTLIEEVGKVWKEGERHGLAGSLAGALRKHGLAEKHAAEVIEMICGLTLDPEVKDRLKYVEDTYRKPLSEVMGVSKLREILRAIASEDTAASIVGFFEKEGPHQYFEDGRFVPKYLADDILKHHRLITLRDTEEVLVYRDGVYKPNGKSFVKEESGRLLAERYNKNRGEEVVECVKVSTYMDRREEPRTLINVENGVLDINTFILTPHSPERMFFNKLPIRYNPAATCPKIEKFLGEIVPTNDDVIQLEEWGGYCLFRSYHIHKALMLTGDGMNGKSTYLMLLRELLGHENVSSRKLSEFETNRFARSELHGKLANIYPDLPDTFLGTTGIFKILTGGDIVTGEKKYFPGFTFVNTAKLLFSANKIPDTGDDSDAFFRRWIIIDFPKKFEGDNCDTKILDKLTTPEELSGFLNLALKGLRRLLETDEFTATLTVDKVRKDYKLRSSPVKAFLDECTTPCFDPHAAIEKMTIYEAYTAYCRSRKLVPKDERGFWRDMRKHANFRSFNSKREGRNVVLVAGLRLLTEEEKSGHMEVTDDLHTPPPPSSLLYYQNLAQQRETPESPDTPESSVGDCEVCGFRRLGSMVGDRFLCFMCQGEDDSP